jgi:hypothetical protein
MYALWSRFQAYATGMERVVEIDSMRGTERENGWVVSIARF